MIQLVQINKRRKFFYMKKVLIFYASYGCVHLSAAKSIQKYITENYEDVESQMVDCMKYINKPIAQNNNSKTKKNTK